MCQETAASLTAGAATALATARTIACVSFDGTANISVPITGLSDVYGSMSPSDGQVLTYDTTNGWQSESPTTGDITGVTAGTNLNGGGSSGDVTLNLDTTITGLTSVTSTAFVGALTGNVTGDLTGNVTGNVSGTALTVTQAAQNSYYKVLGTLTGLTVSGEITANGGVALGDDDVLTLGDSDELSLKHHNSGYSHLTNTTGTLYVDSDSVTFRDDDASPTNFLINQTGIAITGTATGATSFETAAGGTFTTASGNDLNLVYPDGRSLFIKEASTTSVTIDNAQKVTLAGALDVAGAVDMASTLAVAGDVNVESGTFFVDVSNNNVGARNYISIYGCCGKYRWITY